MNRRANPHAPKPHRLTICPAKRIPSYRSFALFRLFAIRFFEAPSLQSIAHCPPIPQPSQRKAASTAAPSFLCRAIAKRAPAPAHTARRFPIQASEDQLQLPPASFSRRASGAVSPLPPNIVASTAPPFMRRASSTRPNQPPAPNRAHNPAFPLLRTSEMNHCTNPHVPKPHRLTICAAKLIPSCRTFALFRSFVIRFFEAPSFQSIAHRALSPHITRRFPIQASEDQLQPPPASFSRRASSTRPNQHPAPNRAHNSAFPLLRTSEMSHCTTPMPRNRTA